MNEIEEARSEGRTAVWRDTSNRCELIRPTRQSQALEKRSSGTATQQDKMQADSRMEEVEEDEDDDLYGSSEKKVPKVVGMEIERERAGVKEEVEKLQEGERSVRKEDVGNEGGDMLVRIDGEGALTVRNLFLTGLSFRRSSTSCPRRSICCRQCSKSSERNPLISFSPFFPILLILHLLPFPPRSIPTTSPLTVFSYLTSVLLAQHKTKSFTSSFGPQAEQWFSTKLSPPLSLPSPPPLPPTNSPHALPFASSSPSFTTSLSRPLDEKVQTSLFPLDESSSPSPTSVTLTLAPS